MTKLLWPPIACCLALVAGVACSRAPDVDGDTATAADALLNEKNAAIAAGDQYSCRVNADGTVACWGRNDHGQLGNGTLTDSAVPVTVSGITGAVAVSAGRSHTCAVLADGSARCWGANESGQIGDGTTTQRLVPTRVSGLAGVTSLSAGGYHTCASLSDGTARCWGLNTYGELGNGTTTNATLPVTVGTWTWVISRLGTQRAFAALSGVAELESGDYSSCARVPNGEVRCWGKNDLGQLGNGTTTPSSSPVAVSGISGAVDISVGASHACAVIGNGRAQCWGMNAYGQLGDGTVYMRTTPVDLQHAITPTFSYALVNITAVAAGMHHTCVISSGQVWCTGRNDKGQLGQDPSIDKMLAEPAPVLATQIAAGALHTCAIRPSGQTVCFGDDTYHQVGNQGFCPATPTLAVTKVSSTTATVLPQGDPNGGIAYTDGEAVDIDLASSLCTPVTEVDVAGSPIVPNPDPIEPSSGLAYSVTSVDEGLDGVRHTRVHFTFTSLHDGNSPPIAIKVKAPSGQVATAGFTLGEVEAIDATGGVMTMSNDELFDAILKGVYDTFGDANHATVSDGPDLYDFDYDKLSVQNDASGISVALQTKVHSGIDGCDPTAIVTMKFKVVLDDQGAIATEWVSVPYVLAIPPLECVIATGGIAIAETALAASVGPSSVMQSVQNNVVALNDTCGGQGCAGLLKSVTHTDQGLQIEVGRLGHTITVRVPYARLSLAPRSSITSYGLALPADEDVLVVGGGLSTACEADAGACDSTHAFGAGGLFNWQGKTLIPSPWPPCDDTECPVYEGRIGPWDHQIGLSRGVADVGVDGLPRLPLPGANVGTLIADEAFGGDDGDLHTYPFTAGLPCKAPYEDGRAIRRVSFGRNDWAATGPYGGQYGTGDAHVTVVLGGVAQFAAACGAS